MSQTTTPAPADDERPAVPLSTGQLSFGAIVLYMLFMLDFAARLGVNAVFPLMQKDLALSDAQIGLLGSVVLLGMTAFVLPFSYLSDKTSKKKAVVAMSAIWGLGSVLTGMVSNFLVLLCGRFLVGIGNSSYAPVSVSVLTSWFKRSRWGAAVGVYNSAMSLGLALGTGLTGLLAATYGWRAPFICIGGLSLLFALLAMFLPRTTAANAEAPAPVALKEAVAVTLKNRTLMLLSLSSGTVNLVTSAYLAWLPMFLVRDMGWSIAEVGGFLGPIYLISGVLTMPVSGWCADKLGRFDKRTRAWFGIPCFLLVCALYGVGFTFKIFPCIVAGMLLFGLPITGMHVATQELVPQRYKASSYGVYVIFIQGMGLIGPALGGLFSQLYGVENALLLLLCFLGASTVILLVAGQTYMKDFDRARSME